LTVQRPRAVVDRRVTVDRNLIELGQGRSVAHLDPQIARHGGIVDPDVIVTALHPDQHVARHARQQLGDGRVVDLSLADAASTDDFLRLVLGAVVLAALLFGTRLARSSPGPVAAETTPLADEFFQAWRSIEEHSGQ
jgi:hypothetical protein